MRADLKKFRRNGGTADFFTRTGIILDSNKRSETYVSGGGGGGYVGIYGARLRPTVIKSQVSTVHEFWLRSDDGIEWSFTNSGSDSINVRPGQTATVLYAGSRKADSFYPFALANHSTQTAAFFDQDPAVAALTSTAFNPGCLLMAILMPICWVGFSILMAVIGKILGGGVLAGVMGFVFGLFGLMLPALWKWRSFNRAHRRMQDHVRGWISELARESPPHRQFSTY